MLIADIGDTGYNFVLFLHILTMVVAFAPAFVNPFINRQTAGNAAVRQSMYAGIAERSMKVYGSLLIVGGFLGFALAGMSGKDANDELFISVSDSWMWPAVALWLGMNGVLHALIIPGEKAIAAGDDAAGKKVEIGGAALTLLFVATLYLMVFKPGA